MFNRYKVEAAARDEYQEIVTYPTIRGNLKMKNKHVGVNYDDRHIPEKNLPDQKVQPNTEGKNLENIVVDLQKKAIKYNSKFYKEEAYKYNWDRDAEIPKGEDELDDPRGLNDIE